MGGGTALGRRVRSIGEASPPPARHSPWLSTAILRALAGGLGLFALLNLAASAGPGGFDLNLWWVDLRWLPLSLASGLEIGGAALLLAFAIRPRAGRARVLAACAILGLLALLALTDAVQFWRLIARGDLRTPMPVPFSLLVALLLAAVAWCHTREHSPTRGRRSAFTAAATLALAGAGFPLAQMVCYGLTDYSRPADAVVVFGARTFADGTPSLALADRVRTGAALVTEGQARWLFVSGGPGDGAVHEVEAMRDLALSLGVPAEAVVLDRAGWSTALTVANAADWMEREGLESTLAVSHSYHLPRIQMEFQRAGRVAFTVPALETRPLRRLPWFMAREVVACWAYWSRGLSG